MPYFHLSYTYNSYQNKAPLGSKLQMLSTSDLLYTLQCLENTIKLTAELQLKESLQHLLVSTKNSRLKRSI